MKNHQSHEGNQMLQSESKLTNESKRLSSETVYAKCRKLLKTNFVSHEIPEDCSVQ